MNNENQITQALQKYYDKVWQDGKLVNVHIGMWGMSHNLEESDIKLDNKLPDEIKLGKKMLIKTAVFKKFKNIEQKIRKYLYSNSFDFPLVPQAHFVPKSRYIEVYSQLVKLREEFMAMANEFVEKYDDYKKEALEFYQQHKDTVNVDLEKYYPSAQHVREKFYMNIISFEIALPTEFKEVNLQDEIDREIINDQARRTAYESYKTEYSKQLSTHMATINDFVGDVVNTLRSKVIEHCSAALAKIGKKEVVSDASIRTLLKHIQEFREMNFVDDKVVENKLNEVERLLQKDHDFETDKDAIALLTQHLTSVVKEAENISDLANVSGEYFRKLA
jgi:hypothetical protein